MLGRLREEGGPRPAGRYDAALGGEEAEGEEALGDPVAGGEVAVAEGTQLRHAQPPLVLLVAPQPVAVGQPLVAVHAFDADHPRGGASELRDGRRVGRVGRVGGDGRCAAVTVVGVAIRVDVAACAAGAGAAAVAACAAADGGSKARTEARVAGLLCPAAPLLHLLEQRRGGHVALDAMHGAQVRLRTW